jgi:hypothetical protein
MSQKNSTEEKKLRREAKALKHTKSDWVMTAVPVKNKYGMDRFSMVKMPSHMFK